MDITIEIRITDSNWRKESPIITREIKFDLPDDFAFSPQQPELIDFGRITAINLSSASKEYKATLEARAAKASEPEPEAEA